MKKSDDKKEPDSEIIEPGQQGGPQLPSGDNDIAQFLQCNVVGPQLPPEARYIDLFAEHTDRPDGLTKLLEKHNPGFIKRMSARLGGRRVRMGYALIIVLFIAFHFVMAVEAGIVVTIFIAVCIFLEITQGGSSIFHKIISKISGMHSYYNPNRD